MYTYSRKQNVHFIEGVKNLCRLCLEDLLDPVPVFTNKDNQCSSLSFRIMLSTGVELTYNENLSNEICKKCFQKVEEYYTFRKKCQSAYIRLKSHIQALKKKTCDKNELKENSDEDDCSDDDNERLVLNFEKEDIENENCLKGENIFSESIESNLKNYKEADQIDETKEPLRKLTEEQTQPEVTASVLAAPGATEEEDNKPDLEISSFLSSILLELGVLKKYGDCLELTENGVMSFELEMNEGNILNLEIVEEVEEANPVPVESVLAEEKASNPEPEEESFVIEYAASVANFKEDLPDGNVTVLNDIDPVELKSGKATLDHVKAICAECNKGFASKSSLARHLRAHSGDRPYICGVCEKRFTQAAVLNRHSLTHLETRPFKCEWCAKSFTQRSGLEAHARRHAPPHRRSLRLHKCTLCPKVFLYPSGLSRHMSTHNGRMYMCVACEKHFNDKSSLLRHLKCCKRRKRSGGKD